MADKDAMRDAGKVQGDPALKAIQELGESVAVGFEVEEERAKKAAKQNTEDLDQIRDANAEMKTEMLAGFKVQGDRLNTLDRRQSAIHGPGQDVESCCLAALDADEKKDIASIARTIRTKPGDKEKLPLFSSEVGSTLVAHWLWASTKIQKQRFGSQAEQAALFEQIDRYEKALCDAFKYEKAAALVTSTTTLGGHWIPDPVATELYRLILDHSVIGSQASHIPMGTKTLDLPVEGASALSVSWGAENTDVTDSVPASDAINKVTLTAKRLQGFAATSWETIQDSPVAILTWVRDKLVEMSGREIDQEALEGDGTNFTGLSDASGVNEIAATGTNGDVIAYQTIVTALFKAAERATREDSRFYVSPLLAAKIIGLVTATEGMPIVQFGNVPGAFARTILGYPMEIHSVISAARTWGTGTALTNMYFGPPKSIVIGDRVGMAWDTSDVADEAFRKYQLHMRLITRLGIAVAVPKAFTRAVNLATA